jgi:LysM repeat protein
MSVVTLVLTGCTGVAPDELQTLSSQITLAPYVTDDFSQTVFSTPESTVSPSATAEPVIYTVVSGDSLSTIAFRFGVDLSELMLTNPAINPNAMSIGTKLVIPAKGDSTEANVNTGLGLPTPVIQTEVNPDCYHMDDGQWICFLLVHNDREQAVGNVSGRVMMAGSSSSFQAACPLNLIPAGGSLPLIAYIQNAEIDPIQMVGDLTTAIPINEADTRYNVMTVSRETIEYSIDHRSADVSGEVILPLTGIVRVLVFAQDASGHVVGFRIWDSGATLESGMTQSFHLFIYSLGDTIADINMVAQIRLQ